MPWWTWLPIGFLVVVATATVIMLVLFALTSLRTLSALGETTADALEDVSRSAAALEGRLGALATRSEEVERRTAYLRTEFDRLSLLSWALADARGALKGLRGALPRK